MINSVLGGDIYNKFFVYATSVKFGKLREILLRVYRGQVFSSHTVYTVYNCRQLNNKAPQ